MADLKKTMTLVSELNHSHGVTQRGGKKYTQVVHRMEAFRQMHGTDFGVDTHILVADLVALAFSQSDIRRSFLLR